ncbi:MAG: iron uptake porin [Rhizonema sp. NSF051]|nr:iron uptake porin [Rhizonema sp. NSF051]
MTRLLWKVLKLSPLVFAVTFCVSKSALADQVNQQTTSVNKLAQGSDLGQVTSVSQFSDVQPTDWAFQALQSLVERYGCIAGYPNGTYRGNRAMTRYEFAAGLNSCLDRVNELIATATSDIVKKEDLATLQRLQEEFSAELATLRGRVDALEARTAELEANQFSTTTKLVGEAIFAISDAFGNTRAVDDATLRNNPRLTNGQLRNLGPNTRRTDLDNNAIFADRIRLSLNTSFTGKDLLQIRLQAGNVFNNNNNANFGTTSTGTNETRLAFDGFSNNNAVTIDKINYAFNLTDAVRIKVDANTGEYWENINNFNPEFASSGKGAISRYGRFSPIYRQGQGGAGATVSFNPNGAFTFSVGYLGGGSGGNNLSSNPSIKTGLFDGNYSALAQVSIKPSKVFNIGATYARTYQNGAGAASGFSGVSLFQSTGSNFANAPFGTNTATSADNYGVEATFSPSSKVIIAGWGGYTTAFAQAANAATGTARGNEADAYYYGATLALKDFGRQGNVLGFIFGQPPKLSYNQSRLAGGDGVVRSQRDLNTTYHLEGLYKFQVNNNISVTPAVLVIFNPQDNTRNSTEYVGTLRTTFTF